uniref:Uncharacterized protein n=1 Tax=Rhizophora mucronata TaxID=61149 RepID=A0A2P2QMX6_RHIMU
MRSFCHIACFYVMFAILIIYLLFTCENFPFLFFPSSLTGERV